jgi:hypothetical protein
MKKTTDPRQRAIREELENWAPRLLGDETDTVTTSAQALLIFGNRCYERALSDHVLSQPSPMTNPLMANIKGDAAVKTPANTYQVGGDHYKMTIEPWDVIHAWGLDYFAGSALKYISRAGKKGPRITDLKKARHFLDKAIELEELS